MSLHRLSAPSTVDAYAVTSGRLTASAAALVALAGLIIGIRALTRSAGRWAARTALAAGLIGVVAGGLVVATADGGPGSGSGVVGGFVALTVGVFAIFLGLLALARSRRIS